MILFVRGEKTEIAQILQRRFFPKQAPTNNTLNISLDTRMRPATGGTWYRSVAAGTSGLIKTKLNTCATRQLVTDLLFIRIYTSEEIICAL